MLGFSELFMDRIMIDHLYNPWFDMVAAYAFSTFMLGLIFFWINRRINDAEIYNMLGYGLVVTGGILLLFGRSPFVHPVAIVLLFLATFLWTAAFVAIITVLAVHRLPAAGVPEKYVQDPDDHSVRLYIPFVISFVLLILVWLASSAPFVVLNHVLGDLLPWALAILMVVVVSVTAYLLVPMSYVRETAFLGEAAPPRELDDIFAFSGLATPMERMTVPIVSAAFWGVGVYFASHGLEFEGEDWFGAMFLIFLGASIILTEYSRARRSASFDASDRRARNV